MGYYTERNGLRREIDKTYDISIDAYSLIMDICDKYQKNVSWKYPAYCSDGRGCYGVNDESYQRDLRYEIPDLFRDNTGTISRPKVLFNLDFGTKEPEEYNQFALLDYIEFLADNCRDIEELDYHSFFGHTHIQLKDSNEVFEIFKNEINGAFEKTGLLYLLTDNKKIERVITSGVLIEDIEGEIDGISETGLKELLEIAINYHKKPHPEDIKVSVEKIWDAFERLKTYYTNLDKKASITKIVSDISCGQNEIENLIEDELNYLTKIGNNFRIRHHETNKIEIKDVSHYDYLFDRCMSLIILALKFI